jgi:hypothetical protein
VSSRQTRDWFSTSSLLPIRPKLASLWWMAMLARAFQLSLSLLRCIPPTTLDPYPIQGQPWPTAQAWMRSVGPRSTGTVGTTAVAAASNGRAATAAPARTGRSHTSPSIALQPVSSAQCSEGADRDTVVAALHSTCFLLLLVF